MNNFVSERRVVKYKSKGAIILSIGGSLVSLLCAGEAKTTNLRRPSLPAGSYSDTPAGNSAFKSIRNTIIIMAPAESITGASSLAVKLPSPLSACNIA